MRAGCCGTFLHTGRDQLDLEEQEESVEIQGENDEEEPMNIESGVELSHSEDDLSENEREMHEDMNDID